MKYKPGDRVKQTRNCSGTLAGRIYTVKYGNVRGDYKDWLYIWDTSTSIWEGGCSCKHKWEPVTNRSKVGKKAYQTFLKNGGSRNSKGQFSKKEKIDWEKIGEEILYQYRSKAGWIDEPRMLKEFAKVFQKHGLIDKGVEI